MARRKKPKNESNDQARIRRKLEKIANAATRSEKTSWNRKLQKMQKIIDDKLNPIEDEILELQAQKEAIFDETQILRNIMVLECVHPFDYLTVKDDHILCNFCNKKIGDISGSKKGKDV